jgi:hypothetical protein
MSIHVRRHNAKARRPQWWRRFFWARDEYWAKFAAYKGDLRAKGQGNRQGYGRAFWRGVAIRATRHCENNFGPVPSALHVWSPELRLWVTAPQVLAWLKVPPPMRRIGGLIKPDKSI